MGTLLAWTVHLYTASSALLGLWAVHAIHEQEFRLASYLMIMAMAIDCTDGLLARRFDVRNRIPWIDGRRLDDICDYFTYVLVPAAMFIDAQLLPHPMWAAVPILASAYGFCQVDAKTAEGTFLGWPSYWNVVVIYLYMLGASQTTALAVVLICAAAVFVPIQYIYPSRATAFRGLSMTLSAVWAFLFTWYAVQPEPPAGAVWLTLALGPGSYLLLSLGLHFARTRRAAGA